MQPWSFRAGCLLAATCLLPAAPSTSLLNDWQVDSTYKFKCTETNALWTWTLATEANQVFVSSPNFAQRSMFEEGPYFVNVDPITRAPRVWRIFKMTIEYRARDLDPVPPRPKVDPQGAVFPIACAGLPDKMPLKLPTNERVSNGGIYIYNRYEVQIVDPTRFTPAVPEGNAVQSQKVMGPDGKLAEEVNRNQLLPGGMYKLDPPNGEFINRGKRWPNAAGAWNTLEIVFCPGAVVPKALPAKIQTKLNGMEIFKGPLVGGNPPGNLFGTGARMKSLPFLTEGPILLQSHWGSRVDYRNPKIEDLATCPI